ncbi:hypothetical protein [uncultured Helicobacter sp.]|uniref:hypothetical protein n=1 Tax=uncultured Helicobacter sp. TaxID=175537 RepID=UPI003750D672
MRKWGLEANANRLFGWMMECEGQKHKLVRKKLSSKRKLALCHARKAKPKRARYNHSIPNGALDSIITNSKNKG